MGDGQTTGIAVGSGHSDGQLLAAGLRPMVVVEIAIATACKADVARDRTKGAGCV